MIINRGQFLRQGYTSGISALSTAEIERYHSELMLLYKNFPEHLHKHFINPHAVLDWADTLGRHPAILNAVSVILGQDFFLWKSRGFAKFPGVTHVDWHQDLPHWNLTHNEAVTAWVALSDISENNGCVRVLPGSHLGGMRTSSGVNDANSLFSAGLQLQLSPTEAALSQPMLMKAGEFSLHHGMIVHGSGANSTSEPRLGIAFVYIPAWVKQLGHPDKHVVLVSGHDRTNGFFPENMPPQGDRNLQLTEARDYFERLRSGEIPYNVR